MTKIEAFEKLKMLSENLETTKYDQVVELFKIIGKVPIAVARMKPGTLIDRVRPNNGEDLFTSVDQLGYVKEKEVIEKYMTEYGRANKPHQPMFYGSVESSMIGHPRITALAETSSLLQSPEHICLEGKLYTFSRWKTNQELFLAEVVFCEAAIKANPDIRRSFEKQTESMKREAPNEDIDFYRKFIIFISDQFARPKKTHYDYMISTAYAEYAMDKAGLKGIAFPSVQTSCYGQNIVLPPSVVDAFIEVEALATQRVYKNKMKSVITNHKNCLNPKDCVNNLIWTEVDPQYTSSEEEIRRRLQQ